MSKSFEVTALPVKKRFCPLCKDLEVKSLVINCVSGAYYCRSCGIGGYMSEEFKKNVNNN